MSRAATATPLAIVVVLLAPGLLAGTTRAALEGVDASGASPGVAQPPPELVDRFFATWEARLSDPGFAQRRMDNPVPLGDEFDALPAAQKLALTRLFFERIFETDPDFRERVHPEGREEEWGDNEALALLFLYGLLFDPAAPRRAFEPPAPTLAAPEFPPAEMFLDPFTGETLPSREALVSRISDTRNSSFEPPASRPDFFVPLERHFAPAIDPSRSALRFPGLLPFGGSGEPAPLSARTPATPETPSPLSRLREPFQANQAPRAADLLRSAPPLPGVGAGDAPPDGSERSDGEADPSPPPGESPQEEPSEPGGEPGDPDDGLRLLPPLGIEPVERLVEAVAPADGPGPASHPDPDLSRIGRYVATAPAAAFRTPATYFACSQLPGHDPRCSPTPLPLGSPLTLDADGDPTTGVAGADLLVTLLPRVRPDLAAITPDRSALPKVDPGRVPPAVAPPAPPSVPTPPAPDDAPGALEEAILEAIPGNLTRVGVTVTFEVLPTRPGVPPVPAPTVPKLPPDRVPSLPGLTPDLPARVFVVYSPGFGELPDGVPSDLAASAVAFLGVDGTGGHLPAQTSVSATIDLLALAQGRASLEAAVESRDPGPDLVVFATVGSLGPSGEPVDPVNARLELSPVADLAASIEAPFDGSHLSGLIYTGARSLPDPTPANRTLASPRPLLRASVESVRESAAPGRDRIAVEADRMPETISFSYERLPTAGIRAGYHASQAIANLSGSFSREAGSVRTEASVRLQEFPRDLTVAYVPGQEGGSVAYEASGRIGLVETRFLHASPPDVLSLAASVAQLPHRLDLLWTGEGENMSVAYDASESFGPLTFEASNGPDKPAARGSVASLPPSLRIRTGPDAHSVDARASASADPGSGVIGRIEAAFASDGRYLEGGDPANHLTAKVGEDATRIDLALDGLKLLGVELGGDSTRFELRTAAPAPFHYLLSAPSVLLKGHVFDVPSRVTLVAEDGEITYDAHGERVEWIRTEYSNRGSPPLLASLDVRGLPARATVSLGENGVAYAASDRLESVALQARVPLTPRGHLQAHVAIRDVAREWTLAFGDGAFRFAAPEGIGSVEARAQNRPSERTSRCGYDPAVGRVEPNRLCAGLDLGLETFEAELAIVDVRHVEVSGSGSTRTARVEAGGGAPLVLDADVRLPTGERGRLFATIRNLPRSIAVSIDSATETIAYEASDRIARIAVSASYDSDALGAVTAQLVIEDVPSRWEIALSEARTGFRAEAPVGAIRASALNRPSRRDAPCGLDPITGETALNRLCAGIDLADGTFEITFTLLGLRVLEAKADGTGNAFEVEAGSGGRLLVEAEAQLASGGVARLGIDVSNVPRKIAVRQGVAGHVVYEASEAVAAVRATVEAPVPDFGQVGAEVRLLGVPEAWAALVKEERFAFAASAPVTFLGLVAGNVLPLGAHACGEESAPGPLLSHACASYDDATARFSVSVGIRELARIGYSRESGGNWLRVEAGGGGGFLAKLSATLESSGTFEASVDVSNLPRAITLSQPADGERLSYVASETIRSITVGASAPVTDLGVVRARLAIDSVPEDWSVEWGRDRVGFFAASPVGAVRIAVGNVGAPGEGACVDDPGIVETPNHLCATYDAPGALFSIDASLSGIEEISQVVSPESSRFTVRAGRGDSLHARVHARLDDAPPYRASLDVSNLPRHLHVEQPPEGGRISYWATDVVQSVRAAASGPVASFSDDAEASVEITRVPASWALTFAPGTFGFEADEPVGAIEASVSAGASLPVRCGTTPETGRFSPNRVCAVADLPNGTLAAQARIVGVRKVSSVADETGSTLEIEAGGGEPFLANISAWIAENEPLLALIRIHDLPERVRIDQAPASGTMRYSASSPVGSIHAWARGHAPGVGLLNASLTLTVVPAAWTLRIADGGVEFDAPDGIGAVEARAWNAAFTRLLPCGFSTTALSVAPNRICIDGDLDAGKFSAHLRLVSIRRVALVEALDERGAPAGQSLELEIGGGERLVVEARLSKAGNRTALLADFNRLPSRIGMTLGDSIVYEASENFDIDRLRAEIGPAKGLDAVPEPPTPVHGVSARGDLKAEAYKAVVVLSGVPTRFAYNVGDALLQLENWAPTRSTSLSVDASLTGVPKLGDAAALVVIENVVASPGERQDVEIATRTEKEGDSEVERSSFRTRTPIGPVHVVLLTGDHQARLRLSSVPTSVTVESRMGGAEESLRYVAAEPIESLEVALAVGRSFFAPAAASLRLQDVPHEVQLVLSPRAGGPAFEYRASASTLDFSASVRAELLGGDAQASLDLGFRNLGQCTAVGRLGFSIPSEERIGPDCRDGLRSVAQGVGGYDGYVLLSFPRTDYFFLEAHASYEKKFGDTFNFGFSIGVASVSFEAGAELKLGANVDLSLVLSDFSSLYLVLDFPFRVEGAYEQFAFSWGDTGGSFRIFVGAKLKVHFGFELAGRSIGYDLDVWGYGIDREFTIGPSVAFFHADAHVVDLTGDATRFSFSTGCAGIEASASGGVSVLVSPDPTHAPTMNGFDFHGSRSPHAGAGYHAASRHYVLPVPLWGDDAELYAALAQPLIAVMFFAAAKSEDRHFSVDVDVDVDVDTCGVVDDVVDGIGDVVDDVGDFFGGLF